MADEKDVARERLAMELNWEMERIESTLDTPDCEVQTLWEAADEDQRDYCRLLVGGLLGNPGMILKALALTEPTPDMLEAGGLVLMDDYHWKSEGPLVWKAMLEASHG